MINNAASRLLDLKREQEQLRRLVQDQQHSYKSTNLKKQQGQLQGPAEDQQYSFNATRFLGTT